MLLDPLVQLVAVIALIYVGLIIKLAIITAIGAVLVSTGIIKES